MQQIGNKFAVNDEKWRRAEEIIALLGKVAPANEREGEMKNRWGQILAGSKLEGDEKILFVYEKLGGLVRTQEEEKVHQKKVEEIKKKRKVER